MPVKISAELAAVQTGNVTKDPFGTRVRFQDPRLMREWQTVAAMIDLYCEQHGTGADRLCPECAELLQYATVRLERCHFGTEKPTCAKCPVHCYAPVRREQIRAVMRYSGPRMLWRHPWMTLRHWLDGLKRAPAHTALRRD